MRLSVVGVLALGLMAVGTALVGWWAVPVVGFAWGASVATMKYPGWTAALVGAAAWGALLLFTEIQTGTTEVATLAGGLLGTSAPVVYLMTVGFAAALAGTAATVGRALRVLVTTR